MNESTTTVHDIPRQETLKLAAHTEGSPPSLSAFLGSAGNLTLDQRKLIVEQAVVLFEQNYVHLPLKVAMHAVNPLQRLRVLRARLERQSAATMEPEWLFHAKVTSTFLSVRDLHTNYLLPAPFAGKIAYLPFMIEKSHDSGVDHYLVTRTVQEFLAPQFGPGVEVTHWSGTPIARAVELNGAKFAGSNAAANLARGLDSLTLRPLVMQLPPDEEWVDVTYVGLDGEVDQLRAHWQVTTNLPTMTDSDALTTTATSLGLDLDSDEKSRAKKLLYVPAVVELEDGRSSAELSAPAAVHADDLATTMPGVFRARPVQTSHGSFGHMRIFTFSVENPVAFRDEFVRLAGLLPQHGLIVDVRDNGGGHIHASEFTLQTLTPRPIQPEPVQFISTALNLSLCRRHRSNPTGQIDLGPWFDSLDQATETGAVFSGAHSITPVDGANDIGQTYLGPVVLVTDARCYSATDIFAAGFADHEIGPILGVDDNTGAGGANVWTHGLLSTLMQVPEPDPGSPYQSLPNGANMRVSIRRTLRVAQETGTPVEDLGVVPDRVHSLTRDDLLLGNVDLLDAAGQMLAGMPVHRLDATTSLDGDTLSVDITVAEMDRVDLYLDKRPQRSLDVSGATAHLTIEGAQPGQRLRVDGFAAGALVASRSVKV
ncbi:MAG: S41 family peptidase [Actinomycetota bacterium]|nr:S41 family peptidase [Actinomycetota bacterium]